MSPRAGRRLLAGAALAAVAYYAVWGGEYSLFDLARLDEEAEATRDALARARAETDSLAALERRLARDPETLERVARERFGMVREGETLYRFVPVPPAAPAADAADADP